MTIDFFQPTKHLLKRPREIFFTDPLMVISKEETLAEFIMQHCYCSGCFVC